MNSKTWVLSAGTSNVLVSSFSSVVWVEPSYILSCTFTVITRCAGLVAVTWVVSSVSPDGSLALRVQFTVIVTSSVRGSVDCRQVSAKSTSTGSRSC